MSKLEKQTALPRRRIFRAVELQAINAELAVLFPPKRVRKAKKAKGKR